MDKKNTRKSLMEMAKNNLTSVGDENEVAEKSRESRYELLGMCFVSVWLSFLEKLWQCAEFNEWSNI